jgi:O-methyltransferase
MRQSLAGQTLRRIAGSRGSIVAPLSPDWQRERYIIRETRSKTRLLLSDPAALHLMACARAARLLPGAFAEAGVFKGGSARLICEEKGEAPLHLFDVFEGLQGHPVAGGEEVQRHFGRTHGTFAEVRRLLVSYPDVHIHAGLFPETTAGLDQLRFSFVHLDLDLPGPTLAALEFFHPRLVAGGILILDDYCDRYIKPCVDAWFATRADTLIELPWSQLMVVRQGRST